MATITDKSKKLRHYRLVRRRILRALHQKVYRRLKRPVKLWHVLGIDEDGLRRHIKRHWRGTMSWGNYGQWILVNRLSHREFEITNEKTLRQYFHYRNIRPVWRNEVFNPAS